MSVQVLSEKLQKVLGSVARVVPSRSSWPVISGVLVMAESDRLTVTATDLVTRIEMSVPCKSAESWQVVIPAKTFEGIVGTLPQDVVEIDKGEKSGISDGLSLVCSSIKAQFRGYAAEEFPEGQGYDDDALAVHVEACELRKAIQRVTLAASRDDSHPVLGGVRMTASGQILELAAADGFRLSLQRVALMSAVSSSTRVIVPARALAELGRLLPADDVPVQIGFFGHGNEPTRVVFDLEDGRLEAMLIDGNYPDVARIVPDTWATELEIGREALLQSLKRAGIFARDCENIVMMEVNAPGHVATADVYVSSKETDSGDGSTGLKCVVKGDSVEIGFNVGYLVECLGALNGEGRVWMGFNGDTAPITVKVVGDEQFVYVMMPMHFRK